MPSAVSDRKSHTLYDDWKARRERLAACPASPYQAIETRLLDFLLERYRDSPEAVRPARFPLPMQVFIDHRAIVVHRHLGRGVIPLVANRQDALAHVRSVLDRMRAVPATSEAASDDTIASCAIPPPVDRVEMARAKLCDSNPIVRIRAALYLGKAGDLDDVGLLSDLLSLPAGPNEHPREREVLLYAMHRLTGAATEAIDLSEILPLAAKAKRRATGHLAMKRRGIRAEDCWLFVLFLALAATCFALIVVLSTPR